MLTKRQYQVLEKRARGIPVKAIAADLGISENTVKRFTYDAFKRLDAESLAQAMYNMGWINIRPYEDVIREKIELEEAAHNARVSYLRNMLTTEVP